MKIFNSKQSRISIRHDPIMKMFSSKQFRISIRHDPVMKMSAQEMKNHICRKWSCPLLLGNVSSIFTPTPSRFGTIWSSRIFREHSALTASSRKTGPTIPADETAHYTQHF
jgi:hypothetical protein